MTPDASTTSSLPRRSYLFGPLFFGTLVRDGHRARTHWTRVFCFASAALVVMIFMAEEASSYSRYPGGMSRFAQQAFAVFGVTQVCLAAILAPILTGGTISGERSDRTLEVLLSTDITATQLVLGKSFTRTLELMLALLGLLPIGALLMWFGGIAAERLILVEALVVLTVLVGGAVGTFFSSVSRTGYGGIITASFFLPIFWGGGILLLALVSELRILSWRTTEWPATALTPFAPAAILASGGMNRSLISSTIACFVINGLLAFGLMLGSMLVVRRRPHMEGATLLRRALLTIASRVRRLLGRPASSASIRGNPITWRELHRRFLGGWTLWTILLIAGLALLLLAFGVSVTMSSQNEFYFWILGQISLAGVFFLTASIVAGTAFSPEMEAQTFDTLRLSDLTAGELLAGKFWGAMRVAAIPACFVAGAFLFMGGSATIGPHPPPQYLQVKALSSVEWGILLLFLALDAAFFVLAGIWMSLRCRRTAVAVALSMMWPIVLCGGTILLVLALDEWFHIRNEEQWIVALNPGAPYVVLSGKMHFPMDWWSAPLIVQLLWLSVGCAALAGACYRRLWRLSLGGKRG